MGIQLDDGAGGGASAAVNSDNKLQTLATIQSEEHYTTAVKGQGYFANTADTADLLTLVTANTYNMLFLRNLSATLLLIIEKIFISVDTALLTAVLQKNMEKGSITNADTHIPPNMNFSSGKVADVLCHTWDEVGTAGITGLSSGTRINTYIPIIGITKLPIAGSMILGQNDSITIILSNATGGPIEASVGVRFYMNEVS